MSDPDAGRLTLSNPDAMRLRSTLSDVVEYAQRTLAECMQFLCARRAGFPEILQNVRPIFAQIFFVSKSEVKIGRKEVRYDTFEQKKKRT